MKTTTVSKSRPAPAKLDLGARFKREYVAPRKPVLIDTAPACYLVVEGKGEPGGAVFQARVGALYAMAFTVKMTRKFAGKQDYAVGKLEARYFDLGGQRTPPRDKWRWQLLIRTPDFVETGELDRAVAVLRKRGKEGDSALVKLDTIAEGRCVQMLHVGPYDREGDTVEVMAAWAKSQGLRCRGPHHEIYLSDPRRVAPEKLKTILRLPVAPAK